MAEGYYTIEKEAQGEITEKKSRFICDLYHVESEDEIKDIVEALKKKHYQARHVCHAAILGDDSDVLKYSDDGEPSGTAGRPMLDILKGRELTYTLSSKKFIKNSYPLPVSPDISEECSLELEDW